MSKTALYRHFDAEGQLLYVGITCGMSNRDRRHAQKSDWHDQVVRTETEWLPSRGHALALEKVAIQHELPPHNKYNARTAAIEAQPDSAAMAEQAPHNAGSKSLKHPGSPNFLRSGAPVEYQKKFPDMVSEYFRDTGMTPEEIAVAFSVSGRAAQYWLDGEAVPRADKIALIALRDPEGFAKHFGEKAA